MTQHPGHKNNSVTYSALTPKHFGWNHPSLANGQSAPSHYINSSSGDPQKQYVLLSIIYVLLFVSTVSFVSLIVF